ncbi:MAG: hypothetical protein QGF72_05080 [Candidatus Poseidoniaceae archaeon]|nr:hypothetical protein [Candidatus Poseidoniaceae archaeon]
MRSDSNSSTTPPNHENMSDDELAEVVELLKRIGVNGFAAVVMVSLSIDGPNDSAGLQLICGLRQPEVSIAVSNLKQYGLIEIEKIIEGGRGRPKHIYSLIGDFNESSKPFREKAMEKLDAMQKKLQRLEELSESLRNSTR